MAILVASLFLPYTVNFETKIHKGGLGNGTKSPENKSRHAMTRSLDSLPAVPSFLTPSTDLPPRNSSSTKLDDFFKSTASSNRPPLLRLPSATRLGSLTRSDTHSPGWGKPGPGPRFAQPSSQARSPPPASILRYKGFSEDADEDDIFSFPVINRSSKTHDSFEYEAFTIEPSHMSNGGLIAAIDASCDDKIWVGTLGMPTNALSDNVKTSIKEKLEVDFECVSVWVADDDMNGVYEQYCKTILWPHLHYQIPDHPKSKAYEDHSWAFYVKVNESFAETIIKSWKKGDKIWIHDYHLMLVPGIIRRTLSDVEIGFFMHTAFPSSEVFRCLATRKELLEGMLGANMVGFQTDEYVQHFLQTCSRLLNVEAIKNGVLMEDGRLVHVNNFPLGVDVPTVQSRCATADVCSFINSLAEQYQDNKVVIARDKMDGIRGVFQKLSAYEQFLQDHPEYRENVVLIQIATTTTEDLNVMNRVMEVVTRINSSYSSLSHHPLIFLNQDLDPVQWAALLGIADCLMITSLREGMNLTGHEFVLCQDGEFGTTKHSPLILSEFTGAASVLKDNALLVNPWHKKNVAQALARALQMTPEEKSRRWMKMREAVIYHDATKWYKEYISALQMAHKDHAVRDVVSIPRISMPQLKKAYDNASKRLLIIDYEGTLASWTAPTRTILPTPKRSADVLNDLLDDPSNLVYVMSSRPKQELTALFARVPGLGLIAENGGFLRKVGQNKWDSLCNGEHVESWKEGVMSVLSYYQDRVKGSWIEELESCILFKYDQVEDGESAFNQAAECANHINDLCAGQGVQAIPVDRAIFISDKDVNKATAANKIWEGLREANTGTGDIVPDFLMAIGDSREDEHVFDWAHKISKTDASIKECITISVGQRNSAASYKVAQGVTGRLKL